MTTASHNSKPNAFGDAELLTRCRKGDGEAFDVLYNRYRLPLFSYLHRLLPGRADVVDDLFQQTWIKATQNLERYTDQQRFLGWLCRIAHNLVMDFFRSRKHLADEDVPESYASPAPAPDQELAHGQREAALRAAIQKLPADQQEIIALRGQGVAFKDIAKQKGIALNTALGRMHYAVQNLRKLLADYL
ncbi:MAG: sigma-70 family RNA polymerase sigma factor [Victivallales bacterium]|nr:sigma-70 family RNA polymerase sigma factor [Victivallales bacterium]